MKTTHAPHTIIARSHPRTLFALIALLLLTSPGLRPAAAAADGSFILLARGPVPDETPTDVAWSPVADTLDYRIGSLQPYPLGLTVASGGPLEIEDPLTFEGSVTLHHGQAAYSPPGTFERRAAVTQNALTYHRIDLLPAADAPTETPFALPDPPSSLEIVALGAVVGAKPVPLAHALPIVLLVLDGTVTVSPGQAGAALTAGDAIVLAPTPDLSLTATDGTAQIVITAVLTAAETSAYPVVEDDIAFQFTVNDCPDGVAIARLAGAEGGPLCDGVDELDLHRAENVPVTLTDTASGYAISGITDPDGVVAFTNLAPGDYLATFPDAADAKSQCAPSLPGSRDVGFDITASPHSVADGDADRCEAAVSDIAADAAATPAASAGSGSFERVAITLVVGSCPEGTTVADVGFNPEPTVPLCSDPAVEPVPAANVLVVLQGQDGEFRVTTDARGMIELPALLPGRFFVEIPESEFFASRCVVTTLDDPNVYTTNVALSPPNLQDGETLTCEIAIGQVPERRGTPIASTTSDAKEGH